jgi:hypothetical protein
MHPALLLLQDGLESVMNVGALIKSNASRRHVAPSGALLRFILYFHSSNTHTIKVVLSTWPSLITESRVVVIDIIFITHTSCCTPLCALYPCCMYLTGKKERQIFAPPTSVVFTSQGSLSIDWEVFSVLEVPRIKK